MINEAQVEAFRDWREHSAPHDYIPLSEIHGSVLRLVVMKGDELPTLAILLTIYPDGEIQQTDGRITWDEEEPTVAQEQAWNEMRPE